MLPASPGRGMELQVEQPCPQCGARIVLGETDLVLSCAYCGVRNYLHNSGLERYVLPAAGRTRPAGLLLAPYLRFKGTIFLVSANGIDHRVVDTTQAANPVPGLPPSLGLRPQAMRLGRISPEAEHLYLPQTLKANAILEKAAAVSDLTAPAGENLLHRAYIGEQLSCIYLPLVAKQGGLYDGVTDQRLADAEELAAYPLEGRGWRQAWQTRFLAALCPQCGAGLAGEGDCRVMLCTNCQTAWNLGGEGLQRIEWRLAPGTRATALYLPFWKVTAHIPALKIYSFADFVVLSNQPLLPRPQWRERAMSLWIPAVKLRPKLFLQAGRQATLAQWRIAPTEARVPVNLHPVTLSAAEARQAVKVILAAAAASPRRIFPYLPQVQLTEATIQLVYLPFVDQGADWHQPETGVTIGRNNLKFGRAL